jgi:hypothetical protein
MYHVTSSRNRVSVEKYGLDWSRMASAPGIAGSRVPEIHGVFVCRSRFEVDFFVRLNNSGGPVDVWAVDDVSPSELLETASGLFYLPFPVGPGHLTLVDRDVSPPISEPADSAGNAYQSTLTLQVDGSTAQKAEAGDPPKEG